MQIKYFFLKLKNYNKKFQQNLKKRKLKNSLNTYTFIK